MCGFTGYWTFKEEYNDLHIIKNMNATLYHRGPDNNGVWALPKQGIFLGHNRLSILDLSNAGKQPMHSNQYSIVYNGEVYNARIIQSELVKQGIGFNSKTDTEIILKACELWGVEQALSKFIGMFAFALYDNQQQVLYLCRDRLGIKPLYWGLHNETLLFGSELKSFYPYPRWQPKVNMIALENFLSFNYIPSPLSIFEGINKLEAGNYVRINNKKDIKKQTYWQLQDHIIPTNNPDVDYINNLHELLRDSVKIRMLADVPLGAFLSGGIDSSLIVSLMQEASISPIKTFTIGFKENNFNEAIYAKQIAQHLGTEHHELYLTEQDALNIIPNLSKWYDEPFADSSQLPTYLVSNLARKHVTVALSGDGGDEIFAGYNRYIFTERLWGIINKFPSAFLILLQKILKLILAKKWHLICQYIPFLKSIPRLEPKLQTVTELMTYREIKDVYFSIIKLWPKNILIKTQNYQDKIYNQSFTSLSAVSQMQYWDTLRYLPDDILTKIDRASMAVSLEARIPLLDHRVVEYAWQLPVNVKIYKGKTKWPLREILKNYVPSELTDRAKMGFGVPINNWLKTYLKEWSQDLIIDIKNTHKDLLNIPLIENTFNEHQHSKNDWSCHLWGLFMFQEWYINHKNMMASRYNF